MKTALELPNEFLDMNLNAQVLYVNNESGRVYVGVGVCLPDGSSFELEETLYPKGKSGEETAERRQWKLRMWRKVFKVPDELTDEEFLEYGRFYSFSDYFTYYLTVRFVLSKTTERRYMKVLTTEPVPKHPGFTAEYFSMLYRQSVCLYNRMIKNPLSVLSGLSYTEFMNFAKANKGKQQRKQKEQQSESQEAAKVDSVANYI